MKVAICFITLLVSSKKGAVLASPSDERFHFNDEILAEKVPFPGSVTTFLEGNLLSTGQLQCTLAVYKNYTRWENRQKEIKCRGLQIMGVSTKHNSDHWKLRVTKKDGDTHAKVILERFSTQIIPLPEYLIIACCLFQENIMPPDPAVLQLVALPDIHHPIDLERITNNERNYKHPHLIDIAPCPCDLTENNCDTFCCCDPDCPSTYVDVFHCITGWYGGQKWKPFENQSCFNAEKKLEHDDSIICIYFANSAFLGHFYPDISKIEDVASFPSFSLDTRHKDEIRIKSHINKHEKSVHSNLHPRHPRKNVTMPIYHYGETIQVISNHTGVPRSADWYFPISLYDGSCTLSYPIHFLVNLNSLCNVQLEKILKQGTPLNTSLDSKSYVTDSLVLLQGPGSSTYARANTTYLCARGTTIYTKYDTLNTSSFSEITPCELPVLPPPPKYENGVFFDIVLEVKYNLLWKNGNILLKNTTVILGSISVDDGTNQTLKNSVPLLTQHFNVEFNYLMNVANTSIASISTSEETRMKVRSGNPGYNIGLPVISAISSYINGTTFTVVGNYLNLWNADATGRCETAEEFPVLFGVNGVSGCNLEIKMTELNDSCWKLKTMLSDALNSIMPAEYLSVGGNPNVQSNHDFIPLLFDEKLDLGQQPLDNESDPLFNCRNIPNHIHLEIAYTEVSQINYTSVIKIIGAFVRYKTVNTIQCGPYGSGCETINFTLTSSIQFVSASLTRKRIKRYWDMGEIQYCNRETCWGEMLYPFTDYDFPAEAFYSAILLIPPLLCLVLNVP